MARKPANKKAANKPANKQKPVTAKKSEDFKEGVLPADTQAWELEDSIPCEPDESEESEDE